ncbi:MAG: type II secretion system F family protein [Erysipelotrichaceae bacterium]|nr:type II secretion system F family protein [Erysipelotrichaceae bacterium]
MEKLSLNEKYLFTQQLSTVLDSGMSIEEGLMILAEDHNSLISDISKKLYDDILHNGTFLKACEDSDIFDEYFLAMVKIGEVNGRLDSIMKNLSDYYQRKEESDNRIREAITYPIALIAMMDVIVGILYFQVFPVFFNIMRKTGLSSNSTSLQLMNIARSFALIFFVVLTVILVLSLIYVLIKKFNKKSDIDTKLMEMFPFTRNIYDDVLLSRITYALSVFTSSGYPLEEAVKFLPSLVSDSKMEDKLNKVIDMISKDVPLYEAFEESGLYDGMDLSILTLGLKAGKQENTFKKLADIVEDRSSNKIAAFTSLVEPVLIGVLSLMVGLILLAIMLPLISILSSLG